jgi:glycosyltransferase EpsJ
MPFLSVIMPAYNVEKFLPGALDSALAQTDPDFELIAVDDGSTDGTGAVLDLYAQKDARVRVLHQKNAGAHAARNAGIELAAGEYLYFMDGDDWAEPGMFAAMRAVAGRTGADLVIFGFYIDTYHGGKTATAEKKSCPDALYADAASFRRAAADLFDNNLLYAPWNKIVRASFLRAENIRFRPTMWDDYPFNLELVRNVETVAVDARAFYHFNRGLRLSETTKYFPGMREKREEEHRALKELYVHWGLTDDPHAREVVARRYVERMFGVMENVVCANSPLSPREKRAAIGELISSEEVRENIRWARPRSRHMKLMLGIVSTQRAGLSYLLARAVSFSKARFSRLFTYLRSHR